MKGLCLLLTIIACSGYHVTAQGNGAVRLSGGSNTNGLVEVFINNQWRQVCYFSSSLSSVSDVVCHQLGYTSSSYTTGTATASNFISDVSCSSVDQVLLQCFYNTDTSCTSNNVVSVQCEGSRVWDFPYTGQVRLQSGDYSNQGRVEVYCNGQWGGICQDFTASSDIASTICYQLGYDTVDSVSASTSTGTIWLSDVDCNTSNNCVGYCTRGNCPTTEVTTCTAGSAFITCSSTGSGGGYRDVCIVTNIPTGGLIAIAIVVILLFIGCLASVIGIPICICCCLGIGIGAAASSGSRRYEAI